MKTNIEQRYYVFNNIDTGQTWSVVAESFREAESKLPDYVEWNDWFSLSHPNQ